VSSEAIPVVSSLAALVELTATLVRARDSVEVATILRRSVKWMLPIDHVSLVVSKDAGWVHLPAATAFEPSPVIAQVLKTRSAIAIDVDAGAVVGDPSLTTLMVLPLVDENDVGLLILGARDRAAFSALDRGTCHLLAHNVVSALRMVRLLERERAAREAAEAAIRMRDQMMQAVTHDLRNPLGVVMALFEMVVHDAPDAIPAEDADSINISLKRMKGLIDELLDIAKSQSGELKLRRKRTDLSQLLDEAVGSARSLLRGRTLDVAIERGMVGMFDESRIARVLGNLVSNAIKYSPSTGHISISAHRIEAGVEIRVTDSGIGIPPADLPFVFERFQRARNAAGIDGNGIGLASSREVVRAHAGTLEVESVLGKGSTFIVQLPLPS